jgi:hypothetical protein
VSVTYSSVVTWVTETGYITVNRLENNTTVIYQLPILCFICMLYTFSIYEEFKNLKLSDLRIIATLGVGGFGRLVFSS